MKSQIAKLRGVCKAGLLVALWFVGSALAQPESQVDAQTPSLGLVHWPGAVVYPKLNEGKPLSYVDAGGQVELLERTNQWWKVRVGGKVGWINRLFLSLPYGVPYGVPDKASQADAMGVNLLKPTQTQSIPSNLPASVVPEVPDVIDSSNQGDPSTPFLPAPPALAAPPEALITPQPEPVSRSDFQIAMLALEAAWKFKFQLRGLDAHQTAESFTSQLLKNSKLAWTPQVIAPSRLMVGKDYFKLWLKSPKAGYVYVWSEAEDGELTLIFPNQRDADNRVLTGEVLYLPRKNWPIKSTGPAGQARILVMVSEVPRALPPPESLMDEISVVGNAVGHEVLKRHPFWMSNKVSLDDNPGLVHFLNPELSQEDCNPKKPQCSNTYGVKSIKLMKVEPEP